MRLCREPMDNDGIATRSVYKKHVHQQQDQETRGLGMSYTLTSNFYQSQQHYRHADEFCPRRFCYENK